MKICQDHWSKLRTALEERGLGAYFAGDGAEVTRRLARDATEGPSLDSFEPLMAAHMALINNLINVGGPAVLGIDGCPLCFANGQHTLFCTSEDCGRIDYYDDWIDRAADDQAALLLQFSGDGP